MQWFKTCTRYNFGFSTLSPIKSHFDFARVLLSNYPHVCFDLSSSWLFRQARYYGRGMLAGMLPFVVTLVPRYSQFSQGSTAAFLFCTQYHFVFSTDCPIKSHVDFDGVLVFNSTRVCFDISSSLLFRLAAYYGPRTVEELELFVMVFVLNCR